MNFLSPAVMALVRPDAPAASRLAAARGEAPLPPADRLAALAVLAADQDPAVRQAARERLARGPVALLLEGLGPSTDPRLLDILARARGGDPTVADALLRHPAVPDSALSRLAALAPGRLLAAIQDRAIPRPHRARIAAAMNTSKGEEAAPAPDPLPPEGEPKFELPPEGRAGSGGDSPCEEVEFDQALTEETDEELPEGSERKESLYKQILGMSVSQKIELALKGNKEARGILVKDSNKQVCRSVVKSPKITETEVIAYANSRNLSDEVFRTIAANKDFTKLYAVRHALASNPRVPLPIAMRCLNTLKEADVAALAKNRNISSAVSGAARRLVAATQEKQRKQEQVGGGH
jgi:hypothetical protein